MKRGFALALTLWIVAILMVTSILFLEYSKKTVEKSKALNKKLELTIETESLFELLKFYLSTGKFSKNEIHNELLTPFMPTFSNFIKIDSTPYQWRNCKIILQDTAGLLSLEDRNAIVNYIQFNNVVKNNVSVDKKIIDWLDRDTLETINGGESGIYRQYNYSPRNQGYFAAVDELFLIKGLNDLNSTNILSKYLVKSDLRRRNILTMDEVLLKSIYGISDIEIKQLIKLRRRGDFKKLFSFFATINKKIYSEERDGGYPSNILKVTIVCSENSIKKKIIVLVDFNKKSKKAIEILNYKN